MNFRDATTADAAFVASFINRAYRGEEAKRGWTTEAEILDGIRTSTEELSELISKPNNRLVLLYDQLHLLGCMHLETNTAQCYLGMLTVNPDLQNRGLGKKLLHKAKEIACELECPKIVITVITLRKELIEFYLRYGFRPTERFIEFPQDPKFGLAKVPNLQMQYFELLLK
jgi:ribosomal protein S18 acetylase RimI-like enzyme